MGRVAIGVLGACIMIGAMIATVHESREAVRAICQPRGYVGGFADKYTGGGCIAANGDRVLIRDLKHAYPI